MGGPQNFRFGLVPQNFHAASQPVQTGLVNRIKHNKIGLGYMVALLNPGTVITYKQGGE